MDLTAPSFVNIHAHLTWKPSLGLSAFGLSQATVSYPHFLPRESSLTWQICEKLLEIHILLVGAIFSNVSLLCVMPKGNPHCVCPGLADKTWHF